MSCKFTIPTEPGGRRKFRSQTSDNMDRWKAEQGRGREKRKIRREKIRRERVRGQKIQMREKVGKSRNSVFTMICGSGGSKSRLAKAAGADPAGHRSDEKLHAVVVVCAKHISKSKCTKHLRSGPLLEVAMSKKCTPLWREAHFQVKMYKTPQLRTTFGSCDVEKVHAVVARSTFRSQNVQNTPFSDHFWKLRCRKSARRCGAKHISKSKCTKQHHARTTSGSSDVEKVHAVVARSTFRSQHVKNTRRSDHFWRFRCPFASLHYTTTTYTTTTLPSTTLHNMALHYTPLHYNYKYNCNYTTTLHYTKLQYATLHYTTLHSTTLHYTTLHYTRLH